MVEPLDVLAAVAMNAFIGVGIAKIRAIQHGLAEVCNPILHRISPSADLLTSDLVRLDVCDLIDAACQVPYVLIPRATKVLHRKRPRLIPILDNVVLAYYLGVSPAKVPQSKAHAGKVAVTVLDQFGADLHLANTALEEVRRAVEVEGYFLTPVRALEILLWIHIEPIGYYRVGAPPCERLH